MNKQNFKVDKDGVVTFVHSKEQLKKDALADLDNFEARVEQFPDCDQKEVMRAELRWLRVILKDRINEV